MSWRDNLGTLAVGVCVIGVCAVFIGQAVGQPIGPTYVETESMDPTLAPDDGFVAIPAVLTDDPEPGDVVVFKAKQINQGGLTTHRVVKRTERGYITRGDGNPFTDQQSGEPPVKETQIVAEAWQVGGTVVVIPQLGVGVAAVQSGLEAVQRTAAIALGTRALLGTQGVLYLVFGSTVVWYIIGAWRERGKHDRSRERSRRKGQSRWIYVAIGALLIATAATAAMLVPAGAQEYGILSADFSSEKRNTIQAGKSVQFNYSTANSGLLPAVAVFETSGEGITVASDRLTLAPRTVSETTVTVSAPAETGYYRYYVVEYRYLAVLPTETILALYRIHPCAPIVVIDVLLAGAFVLISMQPSFTQARSYARESRGRGLMQRLYR